MSDGQSCDTEAEQAVRGLFGRDLVYLLLWAAQIGGVALFTPLTTRLLGPARFGQAAVAVAVMQVLVAIGSFQLQVAVQRAYARSGEHVARVLVGLAIVVGLVTFAVADLTGPLWIPVTGGHAYTSTIHYAVIWAALTAVTNAALGLIRSRDRLGQFALVTLAQSVFAEVVAVTLVLLVSRTASEYVFGEMVAQAVAVGFALLIARPAVPRRRDAALMTGALRYSAALVPAALGTFVIDVSDRLVIHGEMGAAAVGRYAVARNIGGIAIVLLVALNNVWMPRVFGLANAELRRSVLSASRNAVYALLVPALVGWTVISPLLLEVFAPPSYRPQKLVLIVVLIAVASFPAAAAVTAIRTILLTRSTGWIAVATVLAAAVNLGLNFLLVPVLGIEGSALATLTAYLLRWIVLAGAAARLIRLPALPMPFLLSALGAVGATFAFTRLPDAGPLIALRVVLGAGALAVFGALGASLAAPQRFAWTASVRAWFGLSPAGVIGPASQSIGESVSDPALGSV
jgi:O-antigen/teichoic acid export membrane protein